MEFRPQNFKFTSVVVVFVLDCKNICRSHWYITAVVKVRVFVQTAVFDKLLLITKYFFKLFIIS